jgi:PAS domain S-box-containing protein
MQETKQTVRNVLIAVNAVIVSGSFILKVADPIVVSYTEEIRKADLFNFIFFTPIIMVIISFLLYRAMRPLTRLTALDSLTFEQAQELRTAAFNMPAKVLFLFNLVILSTVGFVALGFDAVVFPFYPFYKRLISMGLIWAYTICSSLAVYVYVKRHMAPILRRTSGLADDKGRRISIKASIVATSVTLSAMMLLFLSVYGYSKTREALIHDDEEAASALLYAVKQKTYACTDRACLEKIINSQTASTQVRLVSADTQEPAPIGFAGTAHPKGAGPKLKMLALDKPFTGMSLATAYWIYQDESTIMRNVTIFFVVIGFFFLIFAGIIGYSVGGEISFALVDIGTRMKKISEDKETLYKELEVVSLDEIGDLTRTFNNLQRNIHQQNILVKDLEAAKHKLEKETLHHAVNHATRLLTESEEKFRILAETTSAAIFIHQGEKLLYANPASELLTGYTRQELLKMDFWEIVHPEFRGLIKERARARLHGDLTQSQYELKVVKKKGEERSVSVTSGLIEYEGKSTVIATFFDITNLREAEEEKTKFYEVSVQQYQERIAEEKRHAMEKEKILMDLHDGVGGITTNISILAELAQKETSMEKMRKSFSTIAQLSQEGIAEIRSFMSGLEKDTDWENLVAELRNQGTNMVAPHNLTLKIGTSLENAQGKPSSLLWINVIKIYKEAITNIIKHAHAKTVMVNLAIDENSLTLSIQDDGSGLNANGRRGRGLVNMRSRAEAIGGKVSITSDTGTCVCLVVPLKHRMIVPDEI